MKEDKLNPVLENNKDFSAENMTRRGFLKTSLAVSTAAALGAVLPAAESAGAEEPLKKSRSGAGITEKVPPRKTNLKQRSNEIMLVQKHEFAMDSFNFENAGVSIPAKVSYETAGKLNDAGDNAILICHYFTGTSHFAGKYTKDDPTSGWWDMLIGPGKIIDTDKYFVLCSNAFSNINFHNPNITTTGPASINPATGREYGMTFPIFTLKDVVKFQKLLTDSLGIKKFKAVIGPSMGGLQAFMWGKLYPGMMEKIISVVAPPMVRPFCLMVPNQLGIEAIMLDPAWNNGNYYGKTPPDKGLMLAFKILLTATRTDLWMEKMFGRQFADPDFKQHKNPFKSFDGRFLVETGIEDIVKGRMQFFDANSYIYIAKANALYDLRENGETKEEAWSKITPETLMIVDESDLMFTRNQAEEAMRHLPDAEAFYYDSGNGHLSCLFDTDYFAQVIRDFMG